jgi:hypothetical protein
MMRLMFGQVEIATTTDKSPRPEVRVVDPIDVNITWLLRDAAAFKIDRAAKSCRTPRRNSDVEAALSSFEALHGWCARVASYFQSSVFSAQALDKAAAHDQRNTRCRRRSVLASSCTKRLKISFTFGCQTRAQQFSRPAVGLMEGRLTSRLDRQCCAASVVVTERRIDQKHRAAV